MHTQVRPLEDFFSHRGDAHVILGLQDTSALTFSQLAQRICERSTVRVSDNTIARALRRLDSEGLVTCNNTEHRHPTYRLTSPGRERAEVIYMLVNALISYEQANMIKTS